jgi:hypothetical protein
VVSRKQNGSGFERQLDGAPGARFERDEMRHDAEHVLGVARHHVVAGHPRLEAERRALDRRCDVGRADVGQHIGDVDSVAGALFRTPVRLVDLLLHQRALEGAVGERIDGVEIHIAVAEESFEFFPLGGAAGERPRRIRRQPQRHAEAPVAGDPRFDFRHVGGEALPHLLPVIAGMHERRIGQMAETIAEIHVRFPVFLFFILWRCVS